MACLDGWRRTPKSPGGPTRLWVLALLLVCNGLSIASKEPAALELDRIEVVASAPLPGGDLPLGWVASHAQVLDGSVLQSTLASDLADVMRRSLLGLVLTPAQGNGQQPDLLFRGFMASPLAGNPQGLSVYLDGVRINESFGDVVNWDFLPPNAIARVSLLPGSPAAFGLNTLGGALVLDTRSGDVSPGLNVEALGGSWGRQGAGLDFGSGTADHHLFVAANRMRDAGWRRHSGSEIRRAFAKFGLGWDRWELLVALHGADNQLEGGQTLPLAMLDQPRQAYTWPDRNENRLSAVSLRAAWQQRPTQRWDGTIYLRRMSNANQSSNIAHDFDSTRVAGLENPEGSLDRSDTRTLAYGASLQWNTTAPSGRFASRSQAGLSVDAGLSDYSRWELPGLFTPDRRISPMGIGEQEVHARTTHRYAGAFFSHTASLGPSWQWQAAVRWNFAAIRLRDLSGENPALEGRHRYARFSPSASAAFAPNRHGNAFIGYSEGMRVPTPMELTCADPAAPCKLPNAFLADPPLRPVIARTLEAGWRSRPSETTRLSLAAFRASLRDDIWFVGSENLHSGYFQNLPRTLRQGVEAQIDWHSGSGLTLAAKYAYTRASFASAVELSAPANSTADTLGRIRVQPGDRLSGIPAHQLNLRLAYRAGAWQAAMDLYAQGPQFSRGDENNLDRHGRLPGFAVLNLEARCALGRGWELLGRLDNLADRRYGAFAVLGENFFTGPGASFDAAHKAATQFRAPGAPRTFWLALRHQWPVRNRIDSLQISNQGGNST